MNVAAFAGVSGSGKTYAIARLIEHFVRIGRTVAAIKHTHHELNDDDRGDTALFRQAGANPVILAGTHDAVVFDLTSSRRVSFRDPAELLTLLDEDIVFIEGWKSFHGWPRVDFDVGTKASTEELLGILDRIWRP